MLDESVRCETNQRPPGRPRAPEPTRGSRRFAEHRRATAWWIRVLIRVQRRQTVATRTARCGLRRSTPHAISVLLELDRRIRAGGRCVVPFRGEPFASRECTPWTAASPAPPYRRQLTQQLDPARSRAVWLGDHITLRTIRWDVTTPGFTEIGPDGGLLRPLTGGDDRQDPRPGPRRPGFTTLHRQPEAGRRGPGASTRWRRRASARGCRSGASRAARGAWAG
jgi:hypothetical protein